MNYKDIKVYLKSKRIIIVNTYNDEAYAALKKQFPKSLKYEEQQQRETTNGIVDLYLKTIAIEVEMRLTQINLVIDLAEKQCGLLHRLIKSKLVDVKIF